MTLPKGNLEKVTTIERFEELCDSVVIAKVDGNLYFGYVDDHNFFVTPDGKCWRFDELEEVYAPADHRCWLVYDYDDDEEE